MVNIEEKQKEIDATDYWDLDILDLEISYFGDEISISIEDYSNKEKYWKITFLLCGKVRYNNDAMNISWRGNKAIKNMKRGAIHHHGQEISIKQYQDDFVECFVELGLMQLTIICRDIKVEHLDLATAHFFWQNNEKKED